MQYDIEVNGQAKQVTVTRRQDRFVVAFGGREWVVDAAQVGAHTLSLLIEREAADATAGTGAIESREISIATDPVTGNFVFGLGTLPMAVGLNTRRRYGRKDEAAGGSGPQRVVAPMPGKVVRILAKQGDRVVHRQPVIVIEAMKMENELRASREGTVTEVLVQEGQSVEAGMLLAVISPA